MFAVRVRTCLKIQELVCEPLGAAQTIAGGVEHPALGELSVVVEGGDQEEQLVVHVQIRVLVRDGVVLGERFVVVVGVRVGVFFEFLHDVVVQRGIEAGAIGRRVAVLHRFAMPAFQHGEQRSERPRAACSGALVAANVDATTTGGAPSRSLASSRSPALSRSPGTRLEAGLPVSFLSARSA
jgi:hypothetical protein